MGGAKLWLLFETCIYGISSRRLGHYIDLGIRLKYTTKKLKIAPKNFQNEKLLIWSDSQEFNELKCIAVLFLHDIPIIRVSEDFLKTNKNETST